MSKETPVHEMTVALARSLAEKHPEARLPCPFCGAGVTGSRLGKHLERVHGDEATRGGDVLTLEGVDLAVLPLSAAPLALWTLVTAFLAFRYGRTSALVGNFMAVGLLLAMAPPLLAGFDRLRASLRVQGDELSLRFGLGRLERRVRMGEELERGRLRERRVSPVMSSYAAQYESGVGEVDSDAGSYLRVLAGGRAVTVGCRKGTAFGKHWVDSGWAQGKPRRRWDITLDRRQMVALEYELARRALLSPR